MSEKPRFLETCVKCSKPFAPDQYRTKCDSCGGMIDISYDLDRVTIHDNAATALERYHELLPVVDPANLVFAGAGNTPCVHAQKLGALIGLDNLFLKDETKNPTGTVKDRPAEVVLSFFGERGVHHFTSSATGNSSTAFAVACVKNTPFEHSIFVGERWLDRITVDAHPRVHVWVLEGRDTSTLEAIAQSRKWEKENNIHPEGGFYNLGRREGLKLAFLEAVDQMQTSFDWYFQGVSTAMGAFGTVKGAEQYLKLGRVDRIPKLGLSQEATCCPQVRAFSEDSPKIEKHHVFEKADGIADAMLKGNPGDTYPIMYEMVKRVGGTFVSVTADEIRQARREIHELEGIPACNASASNIAGLKKLVAEGVVKRGERVLSVMTGSDRDPSKHIRQYKKLVRVGAEWVLAGEVNEDESDETVELTQEGARAAR